MTRRFGKEEAETTRYAVISDIHGNYKALEAFLQYLEKHPADGVICLGDYVTDAPYPERLMELLCRMQETHVCYMIRGNREDYLLNNRDNRQGWKPSSANGMLYYTLCGLRREDLDFFEKLATERDLRAEGCPPLYLCHGTPGNIRGNMLEDPRLREEVLESMPRPYLLGGHSHRQETAHRGGNTYINPGSLGLAIDGVGGRARFAVITGDRRGWRPELLSLPYDTESYLRDFAASGLEEIGMTLCKAVKKTLVTGINYFFRCIQEMEREAAGAGVGLADMPEEVWKRLEERFAL
ncbi:MAG: metallophosphatase family protein [Roseburia sp.]|nr:metallophosphatase family protein [Roseburia sp.]MCM1096629.1 metallophosphatase family protein [Ruminococcus flavefaciens]